MSAITPRFKLPKYTLHADYCAVLCGTLTTRKTSRNGQLLYICSKCAPTIEGLIDGLKS